MNLIRRGIARHGAARIKPGKRPDIGDIRFRSSWEANYARALNVLKAQGKIVSWEYEAHTFVFEGIKRGTRDYTPDFRVVFPDGHVEWHEVKGWMDQKSCTRLKRMAKYHPNEKVVVIGRAWFAAVKKSGAAGAIRGWE